MSFSFLDGRRFLLDNTRRPALVEGPAEAEAEVLCNGAGLVGLLRNSLGSEPGQVFLFRGESAALLRLADCLDGSSDQLWSTA